MKYLEGHFILIESEGKIRINPSGMARSKKKSSLELMQSITRSIENGSYYFTFHALCLSKQRRNVDEMQIIEILESNSTFHEPKKDIYNEKMEAWNYSLRGFTLDNERVRIVLSFNEEDLLIITVINLDE